MYGIHDDDGLIAQLSTPMTVRSNKPVFVSDTLSLTRKVEARSTQRWEIETKIVPLSTSDANRLMVSLVTKGYHTTFEVSVPQNSTVRTQRTQLDDVTVSGGVFEDEITISGSTGLIPMGTFIKFTDHDKIYMTTADITGNGDVGVFPRLSSEIVGKVTQCGDNVMMTCYYDTDSVTGMHYTDGVLMDNGTVKLVEAL